MAVCRGHVGVAVVGHLVGAQHALPCQISTWPVSVTMPALAVVGGAVGLVEHRLVAVERLLGRQDASVPPGDLLLRQRRRRRHRAAGSAASASARPSADRRSILAVFQMQQQRDRQHAAPRRPAPRRQASAAGRRTWPNSSASLETTNSAKPAATPLPIIRATPPRRCGRIEKPAAEQAHRAAQQRQRQQRSGNAAGGGSTRSPTGPAAR